MSIFSKNPIETLIIHPGPQSTGLVLNSLPAGSLPDVVTQCVGPRAEASQPSHGEFQSVCLHRPFVASSSLSHVDLTVRLNHAAHHPNWNSCVLHSSYVKHDYGLTVSIPTYVLKS